MLEKICSKFLSKTAVLKKRKTGFVNNLENAVHAYFYKKLVGSSAEFGSLKTKKVQKTLLFRRKWFKTEFLAF